MPFVDLLRFCKNCRDFLIPKIFVRFFQSNLPLDFKEFRANAIQTIDNEA
jgi:hypothetical protein